MQMLTPLYKYLLPAVFLFASCTTTYQPSSVQYNDYRVNTKQTNSPEISSLLQPYSDSVNRNMNDVIAVFSTETTIRAGQSFRVDHVPGKGTSFFLDDKQKGPTVANPLFAEAVFSIWMGRKPVETQLKDGLLGRAAPAVNAQLSN